MDPNACFDRLNAALASGDTDEAREALADLSGWLRSGGFLPDAWAPPAHGPPTALPGPEAGPVTLARGSLTLRPGASPGASWVLTVDSNGTLGVSSDNGRTVRRATIRALYAGHGAVSAPKGQAR